ncbi:MAG: c-type cytochrome [Kiloniellales bacterium]
MRRSLHVLSLCLTLAGLPFLAIAPALSAGDAAKGERTFNKCKACHSLEAGKNKIGPSLHGLFGRTAGTVEGFKYSQAMADSGVVWDEETISEYLADPKWFIPGNKMTFVGVRDEDDRQDVIAYLKGATK